MKHKRDLRWTVKDADGVVHGIHFPSRNAGITWCSKFFRNFPIDHCGKVMTCLFCVAAETLDESPVRIE
jgi:hypothetical protein